MTKGNASQQNTRRTQCRINAVPNALERIRQVAKKDKNAKFTALLHHITIDRFATAFFSIKKNAAAGIDGLTWKTYEENLEENLKSLHHRAHNG